MGKQKKLSFCRRLPRKRICTEIILPALPPAPPPRFWSRTVLRWIVEADFLLNDPSSFRHFHRPSPLIFMFLIDMVRQSRVGRSAKQKEKKKLAKTFKDTKLERLSAGLLIADTVFIVCERIHKLKHSVCEKQNLTNSKPVASAPRNRCKPTAPTAHS